MLWVTTGQDLSTPCCTEHAVAVARQHDSTQLLMSTKGHCEAAPEDVAFWFLELWRSNVTFLFSTSWFQGFSGPGYQVTQPQTVDATKLQGPGTQAVVKRPVLMEILLL